MSYVQVAFTVVGVVCLVNLMLTLAMIRRVRQHGEKLAVGPMFRGESMTLQAGSRVPGFSVTAASGERRTLADLTGSRSLVGFFAPGCPPCHGQLPEFSDLARTIHGGPTQVLAVITGEGEVAADFAADLADVATVVTELPNGPAATAFSARGRPCFYLVGADGRIEASGRTVRRLTSAVPA
jgi:thiol-disulfide isomerase/thioredoxin